MPPYVVLARKWRPGQFSEIVGQNHIVQTLMNAVIAERIHQSYLFTGSRGIGKTSIARIFAKVIRCENLKKENGDLKSCDNCSSCKEITIGNSVDVLEIDGASNNGVDAIREIRENAKYLPSSGLRRIYIIDEVHMLTTAAFNALLKTLEEPPSHVIFIFATTEPHKIPATILSRCQRFDYRRVTINQIQSRLTEISEAEGIQVEPGSLPLIARSSGGSMRDALSLLDQVIAFSGAKISVHSVRESIGLIEGQALIGILAAVFNRNPLDALHLTEQAYQQGHDLRVLTRSLIEFLHATLLIKIGSPRSTGLELDEEEWNDLQTISSLRSIEEMELIFQVLHQGVEWIARSPQPKIVLDVLLIKCATAETLIHIDAIESENPPSKTQKPTPQTIIEERKPLPFKAGRTLSEQRSEVKTSSQHSITPVIPQLNNKTWEGFIIQVRRSRPLLASMLEHSSGTRLPNLNGDLHDPCLTIYFSPQDAYFREQIQSRAYQEQMNQLSREYFGMTTLRIQVEIKNAGESVAARNERVKNERVESIKEKAQNHPIILEAKSLFGGELSPIDIQEILHERL